MANTKLWQESSIKPSVMDPPRQLNPEFTRDQNGNPISEQEILERMERERAAKQAAEEKAEREKRWEGKDESEILRCELERLRKGVTDDDTFSIRRRSDGALDVHLYGRSFSVLEHVVKYSNRTRTWHITAKGCLDRLASAAVRPDRPRDMKQGDIYEEQADILKELAESAGASEDEVLQRNIKAAEGIANESVRWKTVQSVLFIYLKGIIGDLKCQTSKLEAELEKAKLQISKLESSRPAKKKASKKRGRKPQKPRPAASDEEASPTMPL